MRNFTRSSLLNVRKKCRDLGALPLAVWGEGGGTELSRDLNPSLSLGERELTEPAAKSLVDTNSNVSGAGRMQVLVVGAGAVGLAVARAAAIAGHDVVVAEAASGIRTGVSSRNSEVIHAGLYYPRGSRPASYCPPGRLWLYG